MAKAQANVGYKDDSHWGSFVDAFCDKIVFVFSLWTILIVLHYETEPVALSVVILAVSAGLILYEFAIGAVRVNDYYHERFNASQKKLKGKEAAPFQVDKRKNMIFTKFGHLCAAVMEGKLKQKFESFGVAFVALALPEPSTSPIYVSIGLFCLVMATYMAHKSLAHKLSAYPEFQKVLGSTEAPK